MNKEYSLYPKMIVQDQMFIDFDDIDKFAN